jgi:hypothetical protein
MKTNSEPKVIPYSRERLWEIFDYKDGLLHWREPGLRRTVGAAVGTPAGNGYLTVRLGKKGASKNYMVHRLIFFMHTGEQPPLVDHKDGKKDNNRIENLRAATKSTNGFNRGVTNRSKSGVKGVSLHKASGLWRAQIKAGSECRNLGYFKSLEEAEIAYQQAAAELHGEFATAGGLCRGCGGSVSIP